MKVKVLGFNTFLRIYTETDCKTNARGHLDALRHVFCGLEH